MTTHKQKRRKHNFVRVSGKYEKYDALVNDRMTECAERGITQKGNAYRLPVYHNVWCNRLKGKRPCNCDPCVGVPELLTPPEWLQKKLASASVPICQLAHLPIDASSLRQQREQPNKV
jgi:hypothetical protein